MTEIDIHVFTWNAGKFTDEKLKILQMQLTVKLIKLQMVFVIGFQELNGQEFVARIKDTFIEPSGWKFCEDKSKQIGYKITCSHTFQITTLVFYKGKFFTNIPSITYYSSCQGWKQTKGSNIVKLDIDGNELLLINNHMPFDTQEASIKFCNNLFETLKKYKLENIENVIFFGDLNSRSLIGKISNKKVTYQKVINCTNSGFSCENNINYDDDTCKLLRQIENCKKLTDDQVLLKTLNENDTLLNILIIILYLINVV